MAVDKRMKIGFDVSLEIIKEFSFFNAWFHMHLNAVDEKLFLIFSFFKQISDEKGSMLNKTVRFYSISLVTWLF